MLKVYLTDGALIQMRSNNLARAPDRGPVTDLRDRCQKCGGNSLLHWARTDGRLGDDSGTRWQVRRGGARRDGGQISQAHLPLDRLHRRSSSPAPRGPLGSLCRGRHNIGERSEKEIISAFVNRIVDQSPQLVTFNGSSFDLPVLRYRAMVCGVPAPDWLCALTSIATRKMRLISATCSPPSAHRTKPRCMSCAG
jgi:hypothetical protein